MAAEALTAPPLHPWLEQFMQAPQERLGELLRGGSRLGSLSQADVPDAIRIIFDGVPRESLEFATLDRALQLLLLAYRSAAPPARMSPVLSCVDALRVASSMKLPGSANFLRQDMDSWLSWTEACPSSPSLDIRAELFSTWALTQRLVSASRFALEPLWLYMCDKIGEVYPSSYLGVALLGLRMLPERPNVPSERAWLGGLLRWAVARRPGVDEFAHEWRALRAIYPRTKAHWRNEVAQTLKHQISQDLQPEIADRWRHDVGLTDENQQQLPPDPIWMDMDPARETQSLLGRLDVPLLSLRNDIHAHIESRERFAESTGNSYFLEASSCNIGMRLLEKGPVEEAALRARLATELARTALRWNPESVYGWALWRDALAKAGAHEAAEIVGWEAIRRFPANEHWRNQLALLLRGLGRIGESKELLIETISRFPRDPVSRNQLAMIFLEEGEFSSVPALLEPAIASGAADAPVFYSMARAIYQLDGPGRALVFVERGLLQDPTSESLIRLQDILVEGRPLPSILSPRSVVSEELALVPLPKPTELGGRMRRLEARLRVRTPEKAWQSAALAEVRAGLASDPHSEYARYILHQLRPDEDTGGFVSAFREAMDRKDPELLDVLESKFGGRRNMFDVARAFLFADVEAATRLSEWLAYDPFRENGSNTALRRFISIRFGEAAEVSIHSMRNTIPQQIIEILAANDNVRQDLIEVAVASLAFPLAA